ncbi:MAG: hypothetical protein Q7S39_05955 [Ignavibacteria bacterium]|nr:hypothetical protein [Ignavibacteria bacterium]
MKINFNIPRFLRKFFLLLISALLFNYCERPTEPPNPNETPNTTIANIPRNNDTLFALQTFHWDGEDNDGYVAGYQYRYVTYHLTMNDSLVQEWKDTKETSLTIAFLSDDDLNKQVFQVRAVDNSGDVDPTPAEKIIYTYKTIFPITEIVSPETNKEYYTLDQVTDWWLGTELIYTARDLDEGGAIVQYAWAVDNGDWHWTNDTLIYIPPSEFSSPLSGTHIVRAISRDNTNLVDPVGDSVLVRLVQPTFTDRILIIDETDENNFPYGVVQPTDADVDSFYAAIFGIKDSWDFKIRGIPPRDTLGKYQLIVWHADDLPSFEPHKLPQNIEVIEDYLNVGGKFFMSGWRILKSFAWNDPFPVAFPEGSFVHDYLHIINVDETVLAPGDCIGFYGVGDYYSDIRVDSTKLLDFPFVFPDSWGLGQINLITEPAGFTDKIYSYRNADNSSYVNYRGQACGLRYYGSSFDAVILGFPMFFINKDDAIIMINEIIQSLNLH